MPAHVTLSFAPKLKLARGRQAREDHAPLGITLLPDKGRPDACGVMALNDRPSKGQATRGIEQHQGNSFTGFKLELNFDSAPDRREVREAECPTGRDRTNRVRARSKPLHHEAPISIGLSCGKRTRGEPAFGLAELREPQPCSGEGFCRSGDGTGKRTGRHQLDLSNIKLTARTNSAAETLGRRQPWLAGGKV